MESVKLTLIQRVFVENCVTKTKAPEVYFFESIYTSRGKHFLISSDTELDLIIPGTEENVHLFTKFRYWFRDLVELRKLSTAGQ